MHQLYHPFADITLASYVTLYIRAFTISETTTQFFISSFVICHPSCVFIQYLHHLKEYLAAGADTTILPLLLEI